jgi:cytoskeletal protein RodZ
MSKIVESEQVRQGGRGKPVFLVLLGSFLLIGIYLLSMLVWSGSESPNSPSQDAARQTASPAASSSNTSRTPAANPAYPAPASPTATGSTGTTNR